MAEQLLGVGFDIHGGGSDLVFPHHENEAAQTRAARGAELARIWMHNGMIQFDRREDGQVGRQHRAAARGARARTGARRVVMYLLSGHYRQPLAFSRRARSSRPTAACSAIREALRRLEPGDASPDGHGATARALLRRAAPTTSTPPRRWPRCSSGCARPTAAATASATRDLREMLGVLGLESLLERRRRRRPTRRGRASWPSSASRRAPSATSPAADELRDELRRAAAGRSATAPQGPELSRSPAVILYGRNPVREALRGRRGERASSERLGDGAGGARAVAGDASSRGSSTPRRSSGAAARAAHQGVCAEAGPYPYADAATSCWQRAEPLIVALDEVQDPQNLGAICRTAECAGADGVVIPERRAAEVTPAVCKASAGAVEHLPIARVRNLADFLADARDAGCWCYGAARRRGERAAPVPTTRPTTPGRASCWCSAARAAACARASPRPATS